jgi:hypothetical protein
MITAASAAADNTGSAAFSKLRALAGDWQGTVEWTGAHREPGKINATYYATGNDSAVVENLVVGGKPSMTSVYHLDGGDLRMTHYCAAQNQPRLKAGQIDLARGVIDFGFVDATNLHSPDSPHVDGLQMQFLDPDHIILTFHFITGTKRANETIDLRRVR